MSHTSRREFLADVGRGMLVASVGSGLAQDLGLAPAVLAEGAARRLTFGPLEPLASLMEQTPADRLLSMVVGLSEVAININNELEDVGSAFGKLSQRYCVRGQNGCQAHTDGSEYWDVSDFCDGACDIQSGNTQSEY